MKDSTVHMVGRPLQDYSFPSGHSTAIFAWSTTFSLAVPWLAPMLFTGIVFSTIIHHV
jgi:membrane-associated phospholipid phosphatase